MFTIIDSGDRGHPHKNASGHRSDTGSSPESPSSIPHQSPGQCRDLEQKSIEINSLKEDIDLKEPLIEKEALIKRNDSLFTILNELGVIKKDIIDLVNSKESKLLSRIEAGDKIKISIDGQGKLFNLYYVDSIKSGVRASRVGNSFSISRYDSKIEKIKVFKHVVIEDSMYMSGLRENIPDSVLMDLAYINGWDIDFTHDIRPGDSYSIIYEEIIIEGEKAIDGGYSYF